MPRLTIRLLGGFQVELGEEKVFGFETDKARALLAYLVVEADRPRRRETLASLFWPNRPDAVARANLRQALSRLRRALRDTQPPSFLFVTPTDVQFNTASDHWLDVKELERLSRGPAPGTERLPSAFCGDFLAGFAVPDSEAFQAWVLDRQEYYHRLASDILDEQIAHFEAVGAYEDAAEAARLQIQVEPWLEEAHRRCMRVLALAGRRDEALHQYELCRRALASELGIEPGASTRALCADIRDGAPLAGDRAPRQHRQPSSARLAPKLVAREEELAQLNGHLDAALAGEGRVVFVCGETGSGKTALLEAFAASAMAEHPDLLLLGARCNAPGGAAEPCAPLRGVAEMLFGDFGTRRSAAVPVPEHTERLRAASCAALAALGQHGLGLVDSLVPAASVARRAAPLALAAIPSHASTVDRPAWHVALATALQHAGSKSHGLASQETLFDQLIDTLAALARRHPLLLTFDDLHWVDDGTAAFLFRLGRDLAGCRLLTLAAYRSAPVAIGRRDPQSGEAGHHPLEVVINELRRSAGDITIDLDHADGRSFVEALVDTEPNRLGATFRDALFAHTGGHALFTVESLRNLQERGELRKDEAGRWVAQGRLNWGALPARVEAAIAERIDRLPESCRRLLAVASVEGDEFTAEIVAELTGTAVPDVIASLSGSLARQHHLVRPQTLRRVRGAQHSVYRFTHHLFQVYLYNQLDAVERGRLHGAVAVALTRQAAGDRAEQERLSAQLAWHYEAAGMALPAAHALYEAGRQAVRLSAFKEALEFFEHGLALLAVEPPSAERTAVERLLEIGLLTPRRTLEGWGAATFEGALARAAQQGIKDEDELSQLLTLSAEAERLVAKSQLEDALAAAERLRNMAATLGEDAFVALAHLHSAVACVTMGQITKSEEHVAHVLAWQTPERCMELRSLIGVDIAANAMALSAINLWEAGTIERALARSRQAVSAAEARGDPFGLAWALALATILLLLVRGEEAAASEHVDRLTRLATECGFSLWQTFAEVCAGRLLVSQGEGSAGVTRMRSATAGWQGAGMLVGIPLLAGVFADGCLHAARQLQSTEEAAHARLLAGGLAAVDQGLDLAAKKGARLLEAELRRLRGELLWARREHGAAEEAEACFRTAIAVAAEQGAVALELRAAMSLVRLLMRQGEANDAELATARGQLRAVYDRFTEGWSFPDLQEAAELIGALS